MTADLGDLAGLATAIGLVDADGALVGDWFSRPGDYLSSVLADDSQRAALLDLVDELLGGPDGTADEAGRRWIPVADVPDAGFTAAAVVAELPDRVHVGAGVRLDRTTQSGLGLDVQAFVPLFASARAGVGTAPVDPVLLGQPGADVELDLALDLPAGAAAGGLGLAGVRLGARVPTAAGADPAFRLALTGLRLPGATATRDIVVDADSVDELDDAVLDLLLGLVRAVVADPAVAGPLAGLAAMIGLAEDAVPDFPIADLRGRGAAAALPSWLAQALGEPAARADWLAGLATLLGGTVDATAGAVDLTALGATIRLGVAVQPGAAALPQVVPSLELGTGGASGVRLALHADLVALDLGTGTAVALPALAATVTIASTGQGRLLDAGSAHGLTVGVGSLQAGFGLDAARRPTLVLTAFDADVGATHFDVLDLSSPEALAAAAEQVVAGAVALLLEQLGPAGDAVAVLIGVSAPPGPGPAPDLLDLGAFLADPLGAVTGYWRGLLADHPDAVRSVLTVLRDAVSGAAARAVDVAGDGTEAVPWRMPFALDDAAAVDVLAWQAGEVLSVAVEASVRAGDLAGSGVAAALSTRVVLAELDLAGRHAAFLPAAEGRLLVTGSDGGTLTLGTGLVGASAEALGLGLRWRAGAGVSAGPVAVAPQLLLADTTVPLPELSVGPDGRLALDTAGWAAVEALLGAVARAAGAAAGTSWPAELAGLLGWPPGGGPRLPLADLVADPAAALAAFARELFDVTDGSAALERLLDLLGGLLAGAAVQRLGAGRPDAAWRLPLAAADGSVADPAGPALIATLGPGGPPTEPTLVGAALSGWQPGDPGLDPDTLFGELAADAALDPELADLIAGRGDLVAGLLELVERWAGTDGLVALPDGALPAGVSGHRADEVAHAGPLGAEGLADVLAVALGGALPATVVYVAVAAPGCPDVLRGGALDGVPAERVIDLTGAGLPPEAYTAPAAAAGTWLVRLGARADCRLPDGHADGPDPDGVAGQAARLRRALGPLAASGAALVAHGGAGPAAVRAAAGLPGLAAVVTAGTPWSPVSVDVLDRLPAGETLRLLGALLPPVDPDEPDDPDLGLARALLGGLLGLDPLDDPVRELRPPGGLADAASAAVAAGVAVHAVVGSVSEPAILRAATAACAAALAARARARADAGVPVPESTRVGVAVPLVPALPRGGLVAGVRAELDLIGLPAGSAGTVTGPALRLQVELSAAAGWLVGGPDPGRQPGLSRPLALRRLSATVDVPLRAGDPGLRATLVLHDATVFGVSRTRWLVQVGPDAPAVATGLLPEVRALVGELARRFTPAPDGPPPDPGLTALRDALIALGLLTPDGGADPVTLERLLFDPAATGTAALADPGRRSALATALRTLAGDTRAAPGDTVRSETPGAVTDLDLLARRIAVTATGLGAVPWAATVAVTGGQLTGTVRLGPDLPAPADPAAADPLAAPGAAVLVATGPAALLDARLRLRHPGRVEDVALWPSPDPAAVGDALTHAVPAVLLHLLLDALRGTLTGSVPAAGAAVDLLLDALGLLGPAPAPTIPGLPPPPRPLRLPAALLRDPARWLAALPAARGPSGLVALVPGVLDALRGLLGAAGDAGTLRVTEGVGLRAAAADGRLVLAADLDTGTFGGLQLAVGGSAGLSVGPGGGPLPDVRLALAVPGTGAIRLAVGAGAGGTVGVSLALAPDGGAEIPLLPTGPGLGGIATAAGSAAVRALPPLLDALAARDPAGAPDEPLEIAGRLVARLGDALGLRKDDPGGRVFDGGALAAFGHDPAAALAARAADLAAAGLGLVEQAVGPLLGGAASRSVAVRSGAVVVTVGGLVVRWRPGTTRVEVAVTADGLPGVGSARAALAVDPTGLLDLDLTVGPAELVAGPVTLRPYTRFHTGSALPGGPTVETGLDAGTDRRLAARWSPASGTVALLSISGPSGPSPVESTVPADVAVALLGVAVELAGSVVLALDPVRQALARPVLGTTARDLLTGVALADPDAAHPDPRLLPGLLDPATVARRLATLLGNLADATSAGVTIADALVLRVHHASATGTDTYGFRLSLAKPFPLGGGDVTVTLEDDASWISGTVSDGLTVTVLSVDAAGDVTFRPGLAVGGVGVRLARADGPLLDAGITLDSVALHLFADIETGDGTATLAGGAHLELAGLAVPMAGASGGDNAVARGLLGSGGDADQAPKPRFSPAVAVQKHPGGPVLVTLSAGPGAGPWWLVIQRAFGPVYVEQVGFAVTVEQDRIGSFGLLIDGSVSLLGLSASVDDLSLTYLVSAGRSPLDPAAWRVDLAGFAVTSDIGGLTLAGGLRKFPVPAGGVEYLGLLLAKFGVYGISVYGGYGLVGPEHDRFAALFLFGAVNGPIGGPPAFFVTGIGGGFGINRALTYPSDLGQFGSYPFIKALDPAARPGDPMAELAAVRDFFPARRGTFWFAAGVSFTSFALVDGVAVIAVQVGQGFELTLLGLARMALPRPQAALVSVELGLLARFSTQEGLLLVQAQLTDNSWLLYPSVRLTGGFAFATWFRGPNRGQFVLTLGGYHPSFRREGYPSVPRLGIAWRVNSAISITGESYFALTSEAVMAGARIEARARFGPAWATLTVGGDGIVFFDPFWLSVTVYASISAGVTIDVWIGEITISVTLSARVTLEGPPFHGKANFSVGPVDLTVEFGDRPSQPREIPWDQFVAKYLEQADPGVGHVLAAVPGRGAVPPSGSAGTGGARSPDGSDANPFRVVAEFELTVTSAAPVRELARAGTVSDLPTVPEVSAAPMRQPAKPRVTLRLTGPDTDGTDHISRLVVQPQKLGAFAIGTWGPAQSQDNPKVPSGTVLSAVDRILLRAEATIAAPTTGTAPAIRYRQVETSRRRPLPFVVEYTADRQTELTEGSATLAALVPDVGAGGTLPVAAGLLAGRAGRAAADVAAWTGARAAAPLLGSLAEGLGGAIRLVAAEPVVPPAPPEPPAPRPPTVSALLSAPAGPPPTDQRPVAPGITTVGDELRSQLRDRFGLAGGAAPRLDAIDRGLDAATPARLLRVPLPVADTDRTVLTTGLPPVTRTGKSGPQAVAGRGADPEVGARLELLAKDLTGDGAGLTDGDVAVLRLPDAGRDVDPERRPRLRILQGQVRVVALLPGGVVARDVVLAAVTPGGAPRAEIPLPPGTRTVACLAGTSDPIPGRVGPPTVAGWVAHAPVAYLGDEVWLGAGVAVRSTGRVPARGIGYAQAGWVTPDALVAGDTAVVSTFADVELSVVAVAVEGGSGSADDVAFGLAGARRVAGPDGRPQPPVVVADGARTVAVYPIEPDPTGQDPGPVTVTVATAPGRRLAGVAGGTGTDATAFAAAVATRGLDDLVPPAATDGLRPHRVLWTEA